MSKDNFLNRLRQLRATDINARDVYSDLSQRCNDEELKQQFRQFAAEEAGHIALVKSLLDLLQAH